MAYFRLRHKVSVLHGYWRCQSPERYGAADDVAGQCDVSVIAVVVAVVDGDGNRTRANDHDRNNEDDEDNTEDPCTSYRLPAPPVSRAYERCLLASPRAWQVGVGEE